MFYLCQSVPTAGGRLGKVRKCIYWPGDRWLVRGRSHLSTGPLVSRGCQEPLEATKTVRSWTPILLDARSELRTQDDWQRFRGILLFRFHDDILIFADGVRHEAK